MRVKFNDFAKEAKDNYEEYKKTFDRVLLSGWYVLGTEVQNFEVELAKFIGTKYAVGVASGTDALTLSIRSLGLEPTDEVIIPANVYPTAFGVALSGVIIKLADVDPQTLNISLETIKKSTTSKTKAIVIVHLYGNPVDINPIKEFAKKRGIYLIEDCAQAIGAQYDNKTVGTYGDVACFSFYPTKNLGAFGDGGAILTNDEKIYEKIKLLRMYGEKKRYESVLVGYNSRLDEIQAAILRTKLKHLVEWNKKRRNIAKIYRLGFNDLPITLVDELSVSQSVYHLFVIQVKDRKKLMKYLKEKEIDSAIHYPTPIHLTESFSYLGYKKGNFPVTEKSSKQILSLPIHSNLTDDGVQYVVSCIRSFFDK